MSIGWPLSLPKKPQVSGFSETFGDSTIKSDVDNGPRKVRRRFTYVPSVYNIQIPLNTSQVEDFTEFYEVSTESGTQKFTWVDFYTNAPANYRFITSPQISCEGGVNYTASFQLERVK